MPQLCQIRRNQLKSQSYYSWNHSRVISFVVSGTFTPFFRHVRTDLTLASRYISETPWSKEILDYVLRAQKHLIDLQIPWNTAWDFELSHSSTFPPFFEGLRALSFRLGDDLDTDKFTRALLRPHSSLESLYLGVNRVAGHAIQTASMIGAEEVRYFPNLKEFGVAGVDFDTHGPSHWQQIWNLPVLQRLIVCRCRYTGKFLLKVAAEFPNGGLRLQHLAISLSEDGEDALLSLLDSCRSLRSLHVIMPWFPGPGPLLESIQPHGRSLRTLTLHKLRWVYDPKSILGLELESFCKVCSNIQFLGLQLFAGDLDPSAWSATDGLNNQLASLTVLRELRVLHLRLPHFGCGSNTTDFKTATRVTWEPQRFCSTVFDYMHRHHACPALKVLIVGNHYPIGLGELDGNVWAYPRHCFIKGYQMDVWNRNTAVAVPVPDYRVRELEPDCDLLDFDPHRDWMEVLSGH
jgi:hypothetical protein